MYDIFIISPYTSDDKEVTRLRVVDTNKYVVHLTKVNRVVAYSAITAFEHLLKDYDIPGDYTYWATLCKTMMECAKEVHVLMLDGWDVSQGVQDEIHIAKKLGKDIKYIELEKCYV